MKTLEALHIMKDTASYQWGFVTTAQMQERGILRITLARLAQEGYINRYCQGIYKDAAVPSSSYDEIRAVWLSFNPKKHQFERIRDLQGEYIVSGSTAAYLYGIGDLDPEPLTFTSSVRRQSKREGIRLVRANLDRAEIDIVAGLPVTKPERIIADLIGGGYDVSLVADILESALVQNIPVDEDTLIDRLARYAKRYGLRNGDGADFLDLLKQGRS